MIAVIIAGGSGTRLWPLSTSTQPKQLLALTSERTMVQQAYDRARKLGDTIYVVTEVDPRTTAQDFIARIRRQFCDCKCGIPRGLCI